MPIYQIFIIYYDNNMDKFGSDLYKKAKVSRQILIQNERR